jgi:hypothetical protein
MKEYKETVTTEGKKERKDKRKRKRGNQSIIEPNFECSSSVIVVDKEVLLLDRDITVDVDVDVTSFLSSKGTHHFLFNLLKPISRKGSRQKKKNKIHEKRKKPTDNSLYFLPCNSRTAVVFCNISFEKEEKKCN